MTQHTIALACAATILAITPFAHVLAQKEATDLAVTVAGRMTLIDGYSSEDGGLTILIDGKPILKDRTMALANVLKTVPEKGKAGIVVLGVSTGGNGCPLMLRIIDFNLRPTYISPIFGTCYDDVTIGVQKEGRLKITQPIPGEQKDADWEYHRGHLSADPF